MDRPVSEVDHDASNGNKRRLVEPYTHTWYKAPRAFTVTVPKGFAYRPSVPGLPAAVLALLPNGIAPTYALENASCVHDFVYAHRGRMTYVVHNRLAKPQSSFGQKDMTRSEADAVMLSDEKDPTWLKLYAWLFVRAFGWWAWYDWPDRIGSLFSRS